MGSDDRPRDNQSPHEDNAGLRWTGHALVDVGIAGACAYAKRSRPEDLALSDLDRISDFIVETYYQAKLGTYLSCVFMNASFVQPNEKEPKRKQFIARYCRAHRAEPDPRLSGLRCVFSDLPATSPLVRTHLPLFSAENILNFRPAGETFVPAAGAVPAPSTSHVVPR
jgi:CRISPR-associated protein Cst1